eukprot:TRINITY_DN56_c0_g1_i10.p1 TRINITY_DN56_c0_g1~~TRINITY_DN56_c0_g1_i10.p1  ORF type:complete len:934 (+),score=186.39 TRINITY_DN56_c0_g1_i10:2969-5770(+)
MKDSVRSGLIELAEKMGRRGNPEAWAKWAEKTFEEFLRTTRQLQGEAFFDDGCLPAAAKKDLQRLYDIATVTTVDKGQHDMAIVCKKLYSHLLAKELTSDNYEPVHVNDDTIFARHAAVTDKIGRPPINAHRYLYGSAKLHKPDASFRFIAGARLQQVGRTRAPLTSMSAIEAAVGSILRWAMQALREKDKHHFHKTGIKRCWFVSSINEVCADLRTVDHERAKLVATIDFTTMYTALPQDLLAQRVYEALREAIEYKSKNGASLGFNLAFTTSGDCSAVASSNGTFSLEEIGQWIRMTCEETFIRQNPESATLRQRSGVPMGGRCSAELANLYCYRIESTFLDRLAEERGPDAAKSFAYTWRYIDDILTFNTDASIWQLIPYNMGYKQTNASNTRAVFLGMYITYDQHGHIRTGVEPKGQGWDWRPNRYIAADSTHTPWTKRSIFYGLCIRAGVLSNSMRALQEGIQYYAEGLMARGATKTELIRCMNRYLHSRHASFPWNVMHLRSWFEEWISNYNPARKQAPPSKPQSERRPQPQPQPQASPRTSPRSPENQEEPDVEKENRSTRSGEEDSTQQMLLDLDSERIKAAFQDQQRTQFTSTQYSPNTQEVFKDWLDRRKERMQQQEQQPPQQQEDTPFGGPEQSQRWQAAQEEAPRFRALETEIPHHKLFAHKRAALSAPVAPEAIAHLETRYHVGRAAIERQEDFHWKEAQKQFHQLLQHTLQATQQSPQQQHAPPDSSNNKDKKARKSNRDIDIMEITRNDYVEIMKQLGVPGNKKRKSELFELAQDEKIQTDWETRVYGKATTMEQRRMENGCYAYRCIHCKGIAAYDPLPLSRHQHQCSENPARKPGVPMSVAAEQLKQEQEDAIALAHLRTNDADELRPEIQTRPRTSRARIEQARKTAPDTRSWPLTCQASNSSSSGATPQIIPEP